MLMVLVFAAGVNRAAHASDLTLDIRDQDLASALRRVALEAGVEIVFLPETVAGRRAPTVTGRLGLEKALARLLAGTGLVARRTEQGAFVIGRRRPERPPELNAKPVAAAVSRQTGADVAASDPPSQSDIVVTGTRLRRDGMMLPTPVTIISRSELSRIAPGGLIDALDQLPQLVANETPATAGNFATPAGASVLNLRGIGSNRTLVLLNGRRVVSSSRLGVTDINLLPEAIIRGVEAVTGGATAAYGSDAVSGVVNFILDTDFSGVAGQVQGGISRRGDYDNVELSLAAGASLGERIRVIASFDRFESDRIETWSGRDWFKGWGLVSNSSWPSGGALLLTRPNVGATGYTFGGLIDAPGSTLDRLMFLPDGAATPFVVGTVAAIDSGTRSQSGGTVQNLESVAPSLMPDVERDSQFAHLSFAVSDRVRVFLQGIHGDNRVDNRSRGALQFASWAGTIYRDNAFLDDTIRQVMIDEGLDSFALQRVASPRDLCCGRLILSNDTISLTAGFEAALDGWRINGYYQYGRNDNHFRMHRFPRTDRLHFAMDAVRDPVTGAIVCRVSLFNPVAEQLRGCVPANLFGEGRVSPEAIEYILDPDHDKTINTRLDQHFVELAVNGDLHRGWGHGPIGLAFGVSYREDAIDQRVWELPGIARLLTPVNDPSRGIRGIPPGYAGIDTVRQFSSATEIAGGFHVTEVFAETIVPLHSRIDLSLAGRFANYSGSGGVWAWKVGLDWQLLPALRLRATRSRDTRAANLSERFDAQGQGTYVFDPHFGYAGFSLAQIIGGNSEVQPELGDTTTFGIVLRPTYVAGLSFAVDWLDVRISDAIDLLGAQTIVNGCYAGSESLCRQVIRDPVTEELLLVRNVFLNVAEARVRGIDFELSYETDRTLLGGGDEDLRIRLLANRLIENSSTPYGAPRLDLAGSVTRPDWTLIVNATYGNGPWRGFAQCRFIDGTKLFPTWREGIEVNDNRVAAAAYLDAQVSYRWKLHGGSIEAYLHASNLFDKNPPPVPSFQEFNGAQQVEKYTFDVIGQRFTAGVRFTY